MATAWRPSSLRPVRSHHGQETQGEEAHRQGGGGAAHRKAGRDGLQGGAQEEGAVVE